MTSTFSLFKTPAQQTTKKSPNISGSAGYIWLLLSRYLQSTVRINSLRNWRLHLKQMWGEVLKESEKYLEICSPAGTSSKCPKFVVASFHLWVWNAFPWKPVYEEGLYMEVGYWPWMHSWDYLFRCSLNEFRFIRKCCSVLSGDQSMTFLLFRSNTEHITKCE